jgi:hypothetical protein
LSRVEEVLGWKEGMLALAVERAQPLFASAGVPIEIVRSPLPTREAARRFLTTLEELPRETYRDETYVEAVDDLLRATFERIAEDYTADTARRLREWMLRYFVDPGGRSRCWIWSLLLPRLAGLVPRNPTEPSPLSQERHTRFQNIVRVHFGPDANQRDAADAARAHATALSPLERRLVRLDRSAPTDIAEVDVISELEEVIGCERARQVWRDLRHHFGASDLDRLLDWARNQGARAEMPVDLIQILQ